VSALLSTVTEQCRGGEKKINGLSHRTSQRHVRASATLPDYCFPWLRTGFVGYLANWTRYDDVCFRVFARPWTNWPTSMDITHSLTLERIPKEKRQHAHRLFQCLVAAFRPLCVEELAEIFAIEFDPEAEPHLSEGWRPESPEGAILSTCSTLVTIVEDWGPTYK
jgi:hypothetical protein